VSQSTDPLPTDIATLQALLSQARAERDAVIMDRQQTDVAGMVENWAIPGARAGQSPD
jgi:hypothetical protein